MKITMLDGFGCAECNKDAVSVNYRRGNCVGLPTLQGFGLGSYGKQIEWNTEPVINNYPWNRDGYWDCNDWMTWHKKIAAKYGVARANEVFIIWWNKQGFAAYGQDCMYVNKTFRDYFKSVGLSIDGMATYVMAPVDLIYNTQQTVADTANQVVDDAGNIITNTTGAASSTTGVLKGIIPVAVGLAAVGVGFYIYKHYIKGNSRIKARGATI